MAEPYRTQTAGSHLIGRAVIYTLLVLFALYYLMPLFVMMTTSLKTLDDVRTGKAIFSFEGLGEHRIWTPPSPATYAEWNKFELHVPAATKDRNTFAAIRQMEELKIDGQWKLYFGLVLHAGQVIAPADEVYLSFEAAKEDMSQALPGGLDWILQPKWNQRSTPDGRMLAAAGVKGINLKLMKLGGILTAIKCLKRARELKMKIMLGCMMETSIGTTAGRSVRYGGGVACSFG